MPQSEPLEGDAVEEDKEDFGSKTFSFSFWFLPPTVSPPARILIRAGPASSARGCSNNSGIAPWRGWGSSDCFPINLLPRFPRPPPASIWRSSSCASSPSGSGIMAVRTCITLCSSLVIHPVDIKGDGPRSCIDLKGLDKGWPRRCHLFTFTATWAPNLSIGFIDSPRRWTWRRNLSSAACRAAHGHSAASTPDSWSISLKRLFNCPTSISHRPLAAGSSPDVIVWTSWRCSHHRCTLAWRKDFARSVCSRTTLIPSIRYLAWSLDIAATRWSTCRDWTGSISVTFWTDAGLAISSMLAFSFKAFTTSCSTSSTGSSGSSSSGCSGASSTSSGWRSGISCATGSSCSTGIGTTATIMYLQDFPVPRSRPTWYGPAKSRDIVKDEEALWLLRWGCEVPIDSRHTLQSFLKGTCCCRTCFRHDAISSFRSCGSDLTSVPWASKMSRYILRDSLTAATKPGLHSAHDFHAKIISPSPPWIAVVTPPPLRPASWDISGKLVTMPVGFLLRCPVWPWSKAK